MSSGIGGRRSDCPIMSNTGNGQRRIASEMEYTSGSSPSYSGNQPSSGLVSKKAQP